MSVLPSKFSADTNLNPVLRDVRERGRDIEGCIKQWFTFVKPNFHKYVEPQRHVAGELMLVLLSSPHMMFQINTSKDQLNSLDDHIPDFLMKCLIPCLFYHDINGKTADSTYRYHRAEEY